MKKMVYKVFLTLIFLSAFSASRGQSVPAMTGFVDANNDGRNDWFQDTNGDGVNDVTGKIYAHHFKFEDNNGDGVNDLWADADGDGVNDLLEAFQKKAAKWVDRDGDGIQDAVRPLRGKALTVHVLDMDRDGKNDITQDVYSSKDIKGYQYGLVAEENGLSDPDYQDRNGDGMNDKYESRQNQGNRFGQQMDQFIDNDGDGIADDRGIGRFSSPGKGKAKGKK